MCLSFVLSSDFSMNSLKPEPSFSTLSFSVPFLPFGLFVSHLPVGLILSSFHPSSSFHLCDLVAIPGGVPLVCSFLALESCTSFHLCILCLLFSFFFALGPSRNSILMFAGILDYTNAASQHLTFQVRQ